MCVGRSVKDLPRVGGVGNLTSDLVGGLLELLLDLLTGSLTTSGFTYDRRVSQVKRDSI